MSLIYSLYLAPTIILVHSRKKTETESRWPRIQVRVLFQCNPVKVALVDIFSMPTTFHTRLLIQLQLGLRFLGCILGLVHGRFEGVQRLPA
jgi:hypothetical protein